MERVDNNATHYAGNSPLEQVAWSLECHYDYQRPGKVEARLDRQGVCSGERSQEGSGWRGGMQFRGPFWHHPVTNARRAFGGEGWEIAANFFWHPGRNNVRF
jgi:hypothetical protein